ncbi:MAG: prepilin-type N-terminal cleavage/methylation domain-containing protein [Candidatus Omnitrophica bacterium]|nr:prepilin-type N-terminal cleavage/methylation domain-containing protein [Candidatus Omnitrophota bacterium]
MTSPPTPLPSPRGFTMMELATVGLIISILMAIALPNFLEAQIRARVTAAISDMATISAAIEEYYLSYRAYPPNRVAKTPEGGLVGDPNREDRKDRSNHGLRGGSLSILTTPLAILSLLPGDPFPTEDHGRHLFDYVNALEITGAPIPRARFGAIGSAAYLLASYAPDEDGDVYAAKMPPEGVAYSPTNGTRSDGDLILLGP